MNELRYWQWSMAIAQAELTMRSSLSRTFTDYLQSLESMAEKREKGSHSRFKSGTQQDGAGISKESQTDSCSN